MEGLAQAVIDQAAAKIVFDWWLTFYVAPIICLVFSFAAWRLGKKAEDSDCDQQELFAYAAVASGVFALMSVAAFVINLCLVSHILYPETAAINYLLGQ